MIRTAPPSTLDADVCVVGTGAAGVTIARELIGTGLRVIVLESGPGKKPPGHDPLYEVTSTKLPISHESRARVFGGTTTLWTGGWKRLDQLDFEEREWVPRSGWPISRQALEPFYERATRAAGMSPISDGDGSQFLTSSVLVPTVFHKVSEPHRDFGRAASAELERAENVEVILDAHVIGLERVGRRVERVEVHTSKGPLSVRTRAVVLATGGIENARLLLLSELGNEHDQVGRYYMDHPKAKVGVVETYRPLDVSSWGTFEEDPPIRVGLRVADAVQRSQRLLNSYVWLVPMFERDPLRRVLRRVVRPKTSRMLVVRNYMEQEPDPENRVHLDRDNRDPLGLPKACVAWSIGERDWRTMIEVHRLVARELQLARIGELHSPLLHGERPAFQDASHHMGTTRMGSSPRSSVVDPECRVHSIENLYLAGSSVFPTSGYANPTATIVALAIRLADRLKAAA